MGYLEQVRASHYCINHDEQDIFSSTVFHWTAPAEKPRPLKDAAFYSNGIPLGKGSAGFCAMLDAVWRKPHRLLLAPRVELAGGEYGLEQIGAWMTEAGVTNKYPSQGWPGEYQDFAQMVDGHY
jgi:hypothetical protein